jgi:hypothetical protein
MLPTFAWCSIRVILWIVKLTTRGTYSSEICKGKNGKLWEPAPECHRVTRRAGRQNVTMECLYKLAVTVLSTLPGDTRQFNIFPRGKLTCGVQGGMTLQALGGGGEFALQLVPRQKASPLYWRSSSHTHTCISGHMIQMFWVRINHKLVNYFLGTQRNSGYLIMVRSS